MIALRLLSWTFVICVTGLAVVSVDSQVVDDFGGNPPAISTIDRSVVAEAEHGRTCTPEPSLTDTVVVQDAATDATSIVTFDEALAGADAGAHRVVLYCVEVA